jgi:hypothetical protein
VNPDEARADPLRVRRTERHCSGRLPDDTLLKNDHGIGDAGHQAEVVRDEQQGQAEFLPELALHRIELRVGASGRSSPLAAERTRMPLTAMADFSYVCRRPPGSVAAVPLRVISPAMPAVHD